MESANIEIRNLTIEDYKMLKESMAHAYASIGSQYWKEEAREKLIKLEHRVKFNNT